MAKWTCICAYMTSILLFDGSKRKRAANTLINFLNDVMGLVGSIWSECDSAIIGSRTCDVAGTNMCLQND